MSVDELLTDATATPESTPETEAAATPAPLAVPPTTPPPETVEDRSWAAIKANEKRLISERAQFKAERKSAEGSQQELAAAQARVQELEGGLRDDPLAFLERSGVKFEDLANRVLNDGKATPEELIRKQQAASSSELTAMREEIRSLREAADQRDNERLISTYQAELSETLKGSEFELLRAYPDAEGMVFNAASAYASEHNSVLQPADAARRIQEGIKEQLKTLSSNQAVRNLLGLSEAAADTATETTDEPADETPTTLTNALAATPAADMTDRTGMSRHQRLMHAARLIPD